MNDINSKFRKIMKDLEKNIQNPEDLEYAKKQISNVFLLVFDEMDNMKELYEQKMDGILQNCAVLNAKVENLEHSFHEMEKELYLEEEGDFEIVCPYCNEEFVVPIEEVKEELECPECHNIIELNWGSEDDGCDGDCGGCHHHCEDDDM